MLARLGRRRAYASFQSVGSGAAGLAAVACVAVGTCAVEDATREHDVSYTVADLACARDAPGHEVVILDDSFLCARQALYVQKAVQCFLLLGTPCRFVRKHLRTTNGISTVSL